MCSLYTSFGILVTCYVLNKLSLSWLNSVSRDLDLIFLEAKPATRKILVPIVVDSDGEMCNIIVTQGEWFHLTWMVPTVVCGHGCRNVGHFRLPNFTSFISFISHRCLLTSTYVLCLEFIFGPALSNVVVRSTVKNFSRYVTPFCHIEYVY
jgi:hypothetical protein